MSPDWKEGKFDVKTTPSLGVAWKSYSGEPRGVQAAFDAVRIWVAFKGLTPPGPVVGAYTKVEGVNPNKAVQMEVWVPVPPGTKGDKEIKVKAVPAQRVAYTVHRGSLLMLPVAHGRLLQFLDEKRLRHDQKSHRQVHLRLDPPNPENPGWETEIQVPLVEA